LVSALPMKPFAPRIMIFSAISDVLPLAERRLRRFQRILVSIAAATRPGQKAWFLAAAPKGRAA
jgi:hypothetical protein